MLCGTKEMLRFRDQAFQKKQLYEELDALVKNLSEQGAFDAILHVDDIDRLNQKMQQFIPNFKPLLTCETGKDFCRNVLVSLIVEDVYEKKGEAASDDDIKAAVKAFVQNPNWVFIFDQLLTEVSELEKYEYFVLLGKPCVLPYIPENEQQVILSLLQSVFPKGNFKQPRNNGENIYSKYFRNLELYADSFDESFKNTAREYFAQITQTHTQNPFFIMNLKRLDINYSKLMTRQIIDVLDWESKEISSDTIRARYKEMLKTRPQYLMLMYVSLMKKGEPALGPIL